VFEFEARRIPTACMDGKHRVRLDALDLNGRNGESQKVEAVNQSNHFWESGYHCYLPPNETAMLPKYSIDCETIL
jgi:hypothetical protein